MNKKILIVFLSIISIFFLTAQTCSIGTTSSGLAADCEGEGDILCNDDGEAYECALASYGTGYYTSRASEYDEDCAEEIEEEAEDDADGDGVTDADDVCEGYDDAEDTDGDGTPDGCDTLTDSDSDGVADTDDVCADADDTVDYDADEIPDCIDDDVMVAECSDTDGGSDYYTTGVVTYDGGSGEVTYTESCSAGYDYTGTLTEYSCNEYGELLTEEVECDYGCADDYASCATEVAVDTTTDTDGDGLSDYDEENTYGTYIDDADSDDDGLTDGEEVLGTYTYTSDPMDDDTDDDTLSDYEEVMEGTDGYISDPNSPDTNDDGIGDVVEVTFGIDPQSTTMDDSYLFFDLQEDSTTAQYTSADGTLTGSVDVLTDDEGVEYGYLDGSDYLTVDVASALAGATRIIVVAHVLPESAQTATVFTQNAVSTGADICDLTMLPFSLGAAGSEYTFTVTTNEMTETLTGGTVTGDEWALLTGIWFADSETAYFYVDNVLVAEASVTGSYIIDGGTVQVGTSACSDPYTGGIAQAKAWSD